MGTLSLFSVESFLKEGVPVKLTTKSKLVLLRHITSFLHPLSYFKMDRAHILATQLSTRKYTYIGTVC